MGQQRLEKDILGEREIPGEALHGIATARALENFSLSGRPVHRGLIHAFGAVKLACLRTNATLGYLGGPMIGPLESACVEMMSGALDEHVVGDDLQQGGGPTTQNKIKEVRGKR
jgi:aspartate ammonia-lyase